MPGNSSTKENTISFQGRTALITGAASGLGRQLALDLAGRGVRLFLGDLNEASLRETIGAIEQGGGKAGGQAVDVTDEAQCRRLISAALEEYRKIDYLILCAGISMWARFDEVTDLSIFKKLMDINFLGAVHCIHPALKSLAENRGMIVTISSLQGVLGIPNHTGYAASKHALNGFLDSLRFEVGERVRFLNVMPGWISGTNLRSNALTAEGSRQKAARKHSKESVTVEESSRLILEAMAADREELFIPAKLRFIPWARLIAPGWLERKILREVDKQKKEESR